MRFNALPTVAAAALLCTTGAAPALPQTPGSMVVMTQCDPRAYDNATSGFRVTPYKSGLRATLAMQYQNEAATPATAVVFGLVSGGRLVGLGEDDGVFARDAVIRHDVNAESGDISAWAADALRGVEGVVRERHGLV